MTDRVRTSARATALIICLLVAALAVPAAWAQSGPPLLGNTTDSLGFSDARLDRLRQGLAEVVTRGDVSGIVFLAQRHGKPVTFDTFGVQDIATNVPMTKDTIFRIYSMTKPITGVALMILFEEGKWFLDDPIAKHIPQFADLKVMRPDGRLEAPAHAPTMRELMSHTAGFTYGIFGNTAVDQKYQAAQILDPNTTLPQMIEKLAKLPLDYQPGTQWKYSVAVDIQGYLVEKLSGQTLDEFFRTRIFEPLGMVDTGFHVPADKRHRLAAVYRYGADGKLEAIDNPRDEPPKLLSGGGGLVSTVSDYMRFCQMLVNGGHLGKTRLLSSGTVALMVGNHLKTAEGGPREIGLYPGAVFGLDFAVIDDPVRAGGYYGKGAYFWGGAAGTWFWIDPVNDLVVVGMIQQMMVPLPGQAASTRPPPLMHALSRSLLYQALLAPEK